ncbi:Gfo/Idh/MocA family oxidoreductase [Helicobacter sp. MIT 05-5293]|uniref:Gfo/Idh/MocA family protein n=1 Tax=Helicobacter sp. MIT 05-5293 TaxID=1548149 RepID=UPI00051E066D|nr:Gfo/Idh/MocA family oxidoreductase [Helicobacter sp. MIT 05-5293]TLD80864.1 Gfo/Idh/MocA family oxidoreductase [Helicobacter sp. MIT 05-5293]
MPIKCALIGYGYWGRNVAKAISVNPAFKLVCIYDEDSNALENARSLYDFTLYPSYESILCDESIEAIFIITPPHTHFTLTKAALEHHKHTFVEKPLTTDLQEAYKLYDLAQKQNVQLYCDHIFLHSPAVNYLKEHIADFGEIVYINARRINLGLFQSNVDVIWDLAIHDLSIIDYLVGLHIKKVSTFKTKYLDYPNDALANINIELESGIIITLNVSWLSPIKVREMMIGGSKKTAIYDETKRDKIAIFDTGVVIKDEFDKNSLYQKMVEYKLGKQEIPNLPHNMALDSSIAFFAQKILVTIPSYSNASSQRHSHIDSKNDKEHILRVIKALEIISRA